MREDALPRGFGDLPEPGDDPFDRCDDEDEEAEVALGELGTLEKRIKAIEEKVLYHAAELTRPFCCVDCSDRARAYLAGLSDAAAMLQGREPSRPTPKVELPGAWKAGR